MRVPSPTTAMSGATLASAARTLSSSPAGRRSTAWVARWANATATPLASATRCARVLKAPGAVARSVSFSVPSSGAA
jgi:hypothetical protein